MALENEYKRTDFSVLSKIKESLRQKLHRERKSATMGLKIELGFDDLDMLAAAGKPANRKRNLENNEDI